MTVRSHMLAVGSFTIPAGGNVNVLTVPAGFVAVIRSITIANLTAATHTCHERYRLSGAGSGFTMRRYSILAGETAQSDLWRVINEGDAFALRDTASWAPDVAISGALLEL